MEQRDLINQDMKILQQIVGDALGKNRNGLTLNIVVIGQVSIGSGSKSADKQLTVGNPRSESAKEMWRQRKALQAAKGEK